MEKTNPQSKSKTVVRQWHLVNAKSQILGRLASKIAGLLIGKHKVDLLPNQDKGDNVVVVNFAKIKLTGKKTEQKKYYRHSGYSGGFREISYQQQWVKDPCRVLYKAVKGMLPKNKLAAGRLKRLKIYLDNKHDYSDKFKENEKSR